MVILADFGDFSQVLLEEGFFSAVGGEVVVFFDAEVILRYVAFGEVVGVLVAGVAELFGAFVMGVAEVNGDGKGTFFFDVFHRFADGFGGGVGFGGAGHVGDGLGERKLGFGHPDEFDDLDHGGGEDDGGGVGVADVFGGEDGDAAGDEGGVFAGMEHAGEPIDGGVGIGAAHGFDEGAGGVVVLIAAGVVDDGFALDGFLGDIKIDHDFSAFIFFTFASGEDGDFEGGEGAAGVTVGGGDPVVDGFGAEVEGEIAVASVFIGCGGVND